jgi:hypothetical protein
MLSPRAARPLLVALAVALVVTGCLPSSCRRDTETALFAADSLSRRAAQGVPVDTLAQAWQALGPGEAPLQFPRTVRFLPDGSVMASDAERGALYRFTPTGAHVRNLADEAFDVPYLAGTRGDTLVVFQAGANRIDFLAGGRLVDGASVDVRRPEAGALTYVAVADTMLFVKMLGEAPSARYIDRLGPDGEPVARAPLRGPSWRLAGGLRVWGDTLVSLAGFRPVVRTLPLAFADEATPDSTYLVGFDSPMLGRSRAYAEGDASKPPLLTASAAPHGDRLFALNLRPGWLQIDVFGRDGRLERILTAADSTQVSNYYPRDLDVRRDTTGTYHFAVAFTQPAPRVEMHTWQPGSAPVRRTARTDSLQARQ